MSDMSLYTTDQLIKELVDRCDHGIVSLQMPDSPDDGETLKFGTKGEIHTMMGLAAYISMKVYDDYHMEEECDDD